MKKSILFTAVMAVAVALLCVTCDDNGLGKSDKNDGDANRFIDKFHGGDKPIDPCVGGVSTECCNAQPNYHGCPTNPTPTTYTITFNVNGGNALTPNTATTDTNGKLASLPTPTRSGHTFKGWWTATTGGDSVTINKEYSANNTIFAQWIAITYTLTIAATAGGSVSPSVGAHTYDAGAFISVTANANSGYTFKNWSGASTSTNATVNITMDGNKTLTANFQQNNTQPTTRCTLWIAATAGGSVSPFVGGRIYDVGDLVTVTANADYGYTFKNWSGASTSTNATVNITMDRTKTLTANFQSGIPTPTITTFVDSRDGKTYKKVSIGTQTWMGENLNYDTIGSVCFGSSANNCAKYGRLYNWTTAMNGASSSSLSPSGVQGVCPAGWHLPSNAEWKTLADYIGGWSKAGTRLKTSVDWFISSITYKEGTDDYGFSALPGGYGKSDGSFSVSLSYGVWWNTTEGADNFAGAQQIGSEEGLSNSLFHDKTDLYSIRCVAD